MAATQSVLGVDLGGTKMAIARFDAETMKVEQSEKFPTAGKDFAHVREELVEKINTFRTDNTVAVSIGVPGVVDVATGRIVTMPNIPGSENGDIADFVAKKTGLKVAIDNDVNLFTLAEAMFGAGKGERIVLGITLGTGVGGGIVIDGKVFHGAHGYAGEFGHMLLQPGNPPYETDDKRGEVEQFLSGTAMGKRCEQAGKPDDYLEGEVCEFMRPDIFREVAWLITNLTHAFDPSVIVFGGSAGRALKPHLEKVKNELTKWMLPHVPKPRLVIGTLKDAAVEGAAILAKIL